MRSRLLILTLILASTAFAWLTWDNERNSRIAVVVPLQHVAMDEIVGGFKEELGEDIDVRVYNAQGDATLQAAILQQLSVQGTEIVLPIGTAAAQMTMEKLSNRQIVHMAAKFEEEDRQAHQQVTGVLDELPPQDSMALAVQLIPDLKKVALIYSPADKIYPEVDAFEAEAARHGVEVQRLLVQAQSDIYTMGQQIADDAQLVAILKDHMVVSGIATLVEAARVRGIPLMAADEGSMRGGATFAVGVREAAIGRAGARLVKRLLAGAEAAELPIRHVEEVQLFYQRDSDFDLPFEEVAERLGYIAEEMTG